MTELLLGCGHTRHRKIRVDGREAWTDLVTLDINPDVKPDVVAEIGAAPLPFAADSFDELHAYDVIEHTGDQGDWRGFFREFADYWRILKPGGLFCAIVPAWSGVWAWGDPGHRRVIQVETLTFLDRVTYAAELDGERRTNRTDYRRWWPGDFELVHAEEIGGPCLAFILRAHKPARA
jgi:SAM-dependent methyltransferase